MTDEEHRPGSRNHESGDNGKRNIVQREKRRSRRNVGRETAAFLKEVKKVLDELNPEKDENS